MVSVGYKNLVFEDVDGFFSASKMLKSWTKICAEKKNPRCTNFGKAMNHWLGLSDEKLTEIDKLFIMIKYRTEMSDDLMWRSEIYRDLKPNSPIYNVSETLNEFFFYGKDIYQHRISQMRESEEIFFSLQGVLYRGQGMVSYWNTTRQCPTIKDYVMYAQDYSTLGAYVNVINLCANKNEDFTKLIRYISLLACFHKDHKGLVEELNSDDEVKIGEITKKIYTFPIVYTINNNKQEHQLENLMRLRKHDNGMKEYILTTLEDTGALSFSETNINRVRGMISNEISRLGGNKLLEEWVDKHFTL